MPNEAVIADFSGGMNASVGMDKIADNECLLAENCRFDEQGNLLITGANSLQNTSALVGGSVHSEFIDSFLGAIAGAGTNVYSGVDFKSLSLSPVKNTNGSKMSFGAAPNRVYMDLSAVGYFKDPTIASLLTVDWAPPSATSAVTSTSSSVSVVGGTATGFGFALGTANMQGIGVAVVVTNTLTNLSTSSIVYQTQTVTAAMLVGGVPVGTSTTFLAYYQAQPASTSTSTSTFIFGNANYIWGDAALTPTQVNGATFGFTFSQTSTISGSGNQGNAFVSAICTAYQSASGFVAGTGAAGTLTGTYTWKMTFVGKNGEESDGSSASASIILSAQQGTITAIPAGDGRTASRNIYRKGGTLTSYYLVGSIPDNTSTTFADNQTDLSALTTALILAGDTVGDEPNTRLGNQQVKYPCFHYSRIFWAMGNLLIWSKPANGFAYPVDFQIPVGDGKPINGIFSMGGELFVLKPDSIWRLSGTDENSFLLSKTLSPVGTDWPFTAVLSGGTATGFYFTGRILFANATGVWAFNGYTSNKITPKLDLWFRQVNRTNISLFGNTGFNPPEIVNSNVTALNSAAASPLFYYLSYAEAGKTTPTAMLVFDLERGNVTKRPFAAQSLTVDSQGYIYGGNSAGSIFKLDDWTASDAGLGVQVNLDFQDKYRDFGLRGSRFALEGMEFLIATNRETVTPYLYFDVGANGESLGTISTPSQVPITVFRKAASANSRYCRNVSLRINYQGVKANTGNIPNILLVHVKAYFSPRAARARTGENP